VRPWYGRRTERTRGGELSAILSHKAVALMAIMRRAPCVTAATGLGAQAVSCLGQTKSSSSTRPESTAYDDLPYSGSDLSSSPVDNCLPMPKTEGSH